MVGRKIIALLLATAFLAGCTDSGDEPTASVDPTPETETEETQDTASETPDEPESSEEPGSPEEPEAPEGPEEPTPNTAPEAALSADVATGAAPLDVVFTVNATDADGDAVSWTLDADGDGTVDADGEGNGTATFQYAEEGTYTALLNVTDGEATIEASLEVVVEAPTPETEDRGEYVYEFATGLCHIKSYTDIGGTLYESGYGGGNWIFAETNGVPGLQIEANHPTAGMGLGWDIEAPDCVNGDLIVF